MRKQRGYVEAFDIVGGEKLQAGMIANGMKFVNDDQVIGKWEHFSIIKSRTEFDPQNPTPLTDAGFQEIYFLADGEKYWIFEGWTKGFLLIHYGGEEPIFCYKYTIQKVDNDQFLFLEITGPEPFICVLKKVSNKRYQLNEIGRRDNIDFAFQLDKRVLGEWYSVGYVNSIEDFLPEMPNDELWLKEIEFHEDGSAVRIYSDETWEDQWTEGYLLDRRKMTASAYKIKIINNVEYLFVEWKMGNYVFGGANPSYYVFRKKSKNAFHSTPA